MRSEKFHIYFYLCGYFVISVFWFFGVLADIYDYYGIDKSVYGSLVPDNARYLYNSLYSPPLEVTLHGWTWEFLPFVFGAIFHYFDLDEVSAVVVSSVVNVVFSFFVLRWSLFNVVGHVARLFVFVSFLVYVPFCIGIAKEVFCLVGSFFVLRAFIDYGSSRWFYFCFGMALLLISRPQYAIIPFVFWGVLWVGRNLGLVGVFIAYVVVSYVGGVFSFGADVWDRNDMGYAELWALMNDFQFYFAPLVSIFKFSVMTISMINISDVFDLFSSDFLIFYRLTSFFILVCFVILMLKCYRQDCFLFVIYLYVSISPLVVALQFSQFRYFLAFYTVSIVFVCISISNRERGCAKK